MAEANPVGIDGWRRQVLASFSPEIAQACRVTTVADPDELLLDDVVLGRLSTQGFDVVPYRDPIAFRYYYESRHRNRWDSGERTSVVISCPGPADATPLPFDVVHAARVNRRELDLSLQRLFPNLASDVISELDRADLDAVWQATRSNTSHPLGGNETRDLVLRVVFKLAADMITDDTDLLVQLLRLHLNERNVPERFAQRFATEVDGLQFANAWPVQLLTTSRDSFYRFLQERWERHLADRGVGVDPSPMQIQGKEYLPFNAPEIAATVNDLFTDGRLQAITIDSADSIEGSWEVVGVAVAESPTNASDIESLIKKTAAQLPPEDGSASEWMTFAMRWGELQRVTSDASVDHTTYSQERFAALRDQVDECFTTWLTAKHGTLINRSFLPFPTMVHQVPHLMAHRRHPGDRVALVVVDGLSIAQWLTMRRASKGQWRESLQLTESAAFAWVPTTTSVSRQSIFAGRPPMFFEESIGTTALEEKRWRRFWEDRGWKPAKTAFIKHREHEPDDGLLSRVREAIGGDAPECVAVVINSIDRMIHGAVADPHVLDASIRQWGSSDYVFALAEELTARDYSVYITSDHGNVFAEGQGRPTVGSIPEDRCSRALIFSDAHTIREFHQRHPNTICWPGEGLPETANVLLAGGRTAFASQGGRLHTHGGCSIDEVMVPVIQIGAL